VQIGEIFKSARINMRFNKFKRSKLIKYFLYLKANIIMEPRSNITGTESDLCSLLPPQFVAFQYQLEGRFRE